MILSATRRHAREYLTHRHEARGTMARNEKTKIRVSDWCEKCIAQDTGMKTS